MKKGIVLELQKELLDSNCDLLVALRKAHIIATKLKLESFDNWIKCEMDGYSSYESIPIYREVKGEIKALNPYYGWIPFIVPDIEFEKILSCRKAPDPISSLLNLVKNDKNGFVQYSLSGEIQEILNRFSTPPVRMEMRFFAGITQIQAIVESVKNTLIEWTLKLEQEGIVGEGMSFNDKEIEAAKQIPQTINNYYGNTNVMNGPTENSSIVVGNNTSVEFSYEFAKSSIDEIRNSIKSEHLSAENEADALELANEITEKIAKKRKPSIIKSAFCALKDFLIQVGAGLSVSLIQAKMNGMF